MSVYADLLGSGWKGVPEAIRRLHENGAEGTVRVERHGIARILPLLPPAGEKVSLHIRVVRSGDGERWIRTFDGVHVLTSSVKSARGAIVERWGALQTTMTLAVSSDALRYYVTEARVIGAQLPPRWVPRIVASELVEGPFVRVLLKVGEAFTYSGVLRPR